VTIDPAIVAIPQFAASYSANRDLVDSIADIQRTVREIWSGGRLLAGFTDHGADHSERVMRRVDEVLGSTWTALSEDEGYVLHAACWLHDVAMQDYSVLLGPNPNRPDTYPLSHDEEKVVRESHASRGKDLVANPSLRRVRLKGRDQPVQLRVPPRYWLHVAETVGGHSTAGFRRVQRRKDDSGPTGRASFRYGLLAGLLMMADELDLDYSRAGPLEEMGVDNIDSESLLHLLKHRYVQRIRVDTSASDPNARYVELAFNWPRNQDRQARAYKTWIRQKLISQMRLVEPVLRRDLGVHWDQDWALKISVEETFDVVPVPARVVPLLEREQARAELADLTEQLEELERRFREGKVILLVEPSGPGEDGASKVAEFLAGSLVASRPEAERGGIVTSWLDPLAEGTYESGTGPDAFVQFVSGEAGLQRADGSVSAAEVKGEDRVRTAGVTLRDEEVPEGEESSEQWVEHHQLVSRLLEAGEGGPTRVLVVKNSDRLPRPTRALLKGALERSLAHAEGPVRLILTAQGTRELFGESLPGSVYRCELPPVGRPDLKEFLRGYCLLTERQLEAFAKVAAQDGEEITQAAASGLATEVVAKCVEG